MQILKKELIVMDVEAGSSEEALRVMANHFVDAGVGKSSYPDAIVEREKNYPTALPATAFDIAVPHTFAEHVNEAAMGVCVLRHPVEFKQMGSPDITLHPQLLFMLAITDPKDQIAILRKIMKLIQNEEALNKIKDAKSSDEIYDLVSELLA
ncbi:MAG: PTS sugar transporter subunit IIA [Lachnospiraceae bacterium]|nr:PTS sugar transporter subunit IIA [Lachnospiraceae bacterium]